MADATRVLIIDDEPAIRQVLKMGLRDRGWEIEDVGSGEAAVELLADREFDLFIVDKNLPGISGIAVIAKVRAQDAEACCILITAFASADTAAEALNLDVDAYIEKPFENIIDTADHIEKTLRTRLRRRTSGSITSALDHFERAAQNLRKISPRVGGSRSLTILMAGVSQADSQVITANADSRDRLLTVTTSAEALDRLRVGGLDCFIVDDALKDPGIDELLAALDEKNTGAECVLLCSQAKLEAVTRWIELGVKALIERPLTDAAFTSRIAGVLRRLRALPPPTDG